PQPLHRHLHFTSALLDRGFPRRARPRRPCVVSPACTPLEARAVRGDPVRARARTTRAYSSTGQSPRLITGLFQVRTLVGPPFSMGGGGVSRRVRWDGASLWCCPSAPSSLRRPSLHTPHRLLGAHGAFAR